MQGKILMLEKPTTNRSRTQRGLFYALQRTKVMEKKGYLIVASQMW